MANHNILSKLDRAIVAYIISQGAGTAADVYPSRRSLNKELPCTIVYSEHGTDTIPYTAVFEVDVAIMVRSDPSLDYGETDEDVPREDADARTAATFDLFYADMDNLGAALGATITSYGRALGGDMADFTAQNVRPISVESSFDEKGTSWTDTLNLKVLCCPSNVS